MRTSRAIGAIAVAIASLVANVAMAAADAGQLADFGAERPSVDARRLADWIVASRDAKALPFIVLDKKDARVYVFAAEGRLVGSSPALLGSARGDDSVPGIGERRMADILQKERTTPAGRFAAEMGRNAAGEEILWIDYDAAVSMHAVRTANVAEQRLHRLSTATTADNRISYGCINLPAAFFERVVKTAFRPHDGVVYVLPETRPIAAAFAGFRDDQLRSARGARR